MAANNSAAAENVNYEITSQNVTQSAVATGRERPRSSKYDVKNGHGEACPSKIEEPRFVVTADARALRSAKKTRPLAVSPLDSRRKTDEFPDTLS